jgi:hypothetical protein
MERWGHAGRNNMNLMGLVQLIRFLVVKLIQSDLNFIFNMIVVFITNYSFSERQRPR